MGQTTGPESWPSRLQPLEAGAQNEEHMTGRWKLLENGSCKDNGTELAADYGLRANWRCGMTASGYLELPAARMEMAITEPRGTGNGKQRTGGGQSLIVASSAL